MDKDEESWLTWTLWHQPLLVLIQSWCQHRREGGGSYLMWSDDITPPTKIFLKFIKIFWLVEWCGTVQHTGSIKSLSAPRVKKSFCLIPSQNENPLLFSIFSLLSSLPSSCPRSWASIWCKIKVWWCLEQEGCRSSSTNYCSNFRKTFENLSNQI